MAAHQKKAVRLRAWLIFIDESGLLLARYDLVDSGKILRVCTISDEYVDQEFKTQADLVDYVRKNMKEKGFFEPPIVFSRK